MSLHDGMENKVETALGVSWIWEGRQEKCGHYRVKVSTGSQIKTTFAYEKVTYNPIVMAAHSTIMKTLETTQMSIETQMDKEAMLHLLHRILLSQ